MLKMKNTLAIFFLIPFIALAQEYKKTEINGIKYDCYTQNNGERVCGWSENWFLNDITPEKHRLISIQEKNKLWVMINYPKGNEDNKKIKSSIALAEISCSKHAYRVLQYSNHGDFFMGGDVYPVILSKYDKEWIYIAPGTFMESIIPVYCSKSK